MQTAFQSNILDCHQMSCLYINEVDVCQTKAAISHDSQSHEAEMGSLKQDNNPRPGKIDWSLIKKVREEQPKPEIFLRHESTENVFTVFRQLSYKVAGYCYDIPQDHSVIIAYAKMTDSEKPVGALTYRVALKDTTKNPSENFMDNYYHQVSFLFVDKIYQKKGIGRLLMNAALLAMKQSGKERQIHLEAAKSAIKFFKKMGFVPCSKLKKGVSCRRSIFNNCVNMKYTFH
ncbi:hypothetical protein Btru_040649 [Bulinus truncatus]|nr:hypothetical protein Btru_040649 [Bulinus truncatus]